MLIVHIVQLVEFVYQIAGFYNTQQMLIQIIVPHAILIVQVQAVEIVIIHAIYVKILLVKFAQII